VPSAPILHWASFSHNGSKKPRNEDSLIVFASGPHGAEILPAASSQSITHRDLFFAIADGMGGGNAGDIASATLLQQMTRIIPETFKAAASGLFPDSLAHLSQALATVHQQINSAAAAHPDTAGMATTLALTWFTPENLYLANAGDSRIYRFRAGELVQLSQDHTRAWCQWKRQEITEIQYRSHPRRSILYQVIGAGRPTLSPYLASLPYQVGDRFLICSDGLIDGLSERQLTRGLSESASSPQEIVITLLQRAIDNSGFDDTSLIVIDVSAP
jgi:PPM family protein phosphatase